MLHSLLTKTAILSLITAGALLAGTESAPVDTETSKQATLEDTKNNPQTTCPVMGGTINKKLFVEQDGKRIYVCCAGCIDPLKKDFNKYAAKLESQGQCVETIGADTPVKKKACPVKRSK